MIHVSHLYAKEVEVEWLRFRSFCGSHCGLKGSQWTVEGISGGDCKKRWPEYFVHNHLYFKFKDGLCESIMDHSLWILFSFVNLLIVKILLLSTLYRVMWFCFDGNHICED